MTPTDTPLTPEGGGKKKQEWIVKREAGDLYQIRSYPQIPKRASSYYIIADVFGGGELDAKGNAKKMSAAQEMLDALYWARGFGKNGAVHDKMIHEKIEAAIKKATE